ncbi:hypothetical protein ACP70R_037833 [Stipagrostis hirtigluma subsp. patula]
MAIPILPSIADSFFFVWKYRIILCRGCDRGLPPHGCLGELSGGGHSTHGGLAKLGGAGTMTMASSVVAGVLRTACTGDSWELDAGGHPGHGELGGGECPLHGLHRQLMGAYPRRAPWPWRVRRRWQWALIPFP